MKIIESAIRGFEIRNKAQGIQNPTNNYNPESKYHRQRLQSSTWIPESTAWNQEFKTDRISLRGSKFGSVEKGLLNVTLQMKPTQHVSCVTFYYDGTESVYQILKSDYAFKLRKATKDNFPCGTVYCIVQGIVLSFESLDEFKIQLPCSAHGDLLRCCLLRRLSKWF